MPRTPRRASASSTSAAPATASSRAAATASGPTCTGCSGAEAGGVAGFRYSAAMKAKAEAGLVWDEATLRAYVADPKAVVPAGSMPFAGLRNEQQIDDLRRLPAPGRVGDAP